MQSTIPVDIVKKKLKKRPPKKGNIYNTINVVKQAEKEEFHGI